MKNVLDKVKNFFSLDEIEETKYADFIEFHHIAQNKLIESTHRAAKICVDGKIETDVEKQKLNVSRVMGYGHESILEHSNLIVALEFDKNNDTFKLMEFVDGLKYLNHHTYEVNEDTMVMIIGGSIRGYKHAIRNVDNDNMYIAHLKVLLSGYTPKTLYEDFIKDDVMNPNRFKEIEVAIESGIKFPEEVKTDRLELINLDSIEAIGRRISIIIGRPVPVRDLLDFCTATILFKRLSRTASHQLVRHRNGITQESQRYVDYGKASFIDPLLEEAIANNNFDMDAGPSDKLRAVAEYCITAYNNLRADGMSKQDARAILPNNVSTKLYMTFTFTNLIKFLELRTAKGAQAEIRNIANEVKQLFLANVDIFENDEDMYSYLEPVYKEVEHESYEVVDEDEGEPEVESMSLEEMINYSEENVTEPEEPTYVVRCMNDLKKVDIAKVYYVTDEEGYFKYVDGLWTKVIPRNK